MTHRDDSRLETRRGFLTRAVGFVVLAAGGAPRARGMTGRSTMSGMTGMGGMDMQQRGAIHDSSVVRDTTNLFVMDQNAAQSVVRPPKRDAVPLLTDGQRDDLEHRIRCQCGCTLDVYTCRTTDFSCQVSPAMHRDVMALVEGGYSAQEILDAFVGTYGERALMSPKREGLNWAGYVVPFAALAAGSAAVAVVLRGMQRRAAPAVATSSVVAPKMGSDDELARLDAAIRRDD
jgi:cytochrome c-type biogenesis protein CcmH